MIGLCNSTFIPEHWAAQLVSPVEILWMWREKKEKNDLNFDVKVSNKNPYSKSPFSSAVKTVLGHYAFTIDQAWN